MLDAQEQLARAQASHPNAPDYIEAVSQALANDGHEIPLASLGAIAASVLNGLDNWEHTAAVLWTAVLQNSVFTLHPATATVTFASRAMQTYVEGHLGLAVQPVPHA